jgi:hypothetical protein
MADASATHSRTLQGSVAAVDRIAFDRFFSFRVIYLAIFVFMLLYVFTVTGAEALLENHFRGALDEALQIRDLDSPISTQIRSRIDEGVRNSPWIGIAGARVTMHVFGRQGQLLYLNDQSVMPPPSGLDPASILREAEELLPATGQVEGVSIPIDSLLSGGILVVYAAILLQGLFLYNLSLGRRQSALLSEAQTERDAAASRTESIERELDTVRGRLSELEPAEREHSEEIHGLRAERQALQHKLAALADREEELWSRAARSVELDQERQALEDLLEEAAADLESKNHRIQNLEKSLRRASKSKTASEGARTRENELLARRLRTLYKTLEIDDRAVEDLVALRDESMKLKAEEGIKRLADDADNVAVRRKVGGLPPHLSIFELGFAGKGRIYYTKGRQRRFRVLTVGAKNTQKTDLEYLSRLARSEMA